MMSINELLNAESDLAMIDQELQDQISQMLGTIESGGANNVPPDEPDLDVNEMPAPGTTSPMDENETESIVSFPPSCLTLRCRWGRNHWPD